jgi:hypothetical protein
MIFQCSFKVLAILPGLSPEREARIVMDIVTAHPGERT